MRRLDELVVGAVNRAAAANGRPFDVDTSFAPPSGRYSWAHYGVMVPGLPEPHRAFGFMSIVGTPGVSIFANDHAITTTPRDTAYLVSATSSMRADSAFHTYSIANDCALAADGSLVRFGQDLTFEGSYPNFRVRRAHRDVTVDLAVEATDTVTHFVIIPGYTHWSLLCRYRGTIDHNGTSTAIEGLCTLEYARGVGPHSVPLVGRWQVPATFFTYQVLNVDDSTQLLLTEVLGPRGFTLARAVYLRGLGDHGSAVSRGVEFEIGATSARATPSGGSMRLPGSFRWRSQEAGLALRGVSADDWQYGLGAGFVGSFDYEGTLRDRPFHGVGYIEYIDLRT